MSDNMNSMSLSKTSGINWFDYDDGDDNCMQAVMALLNCSKRSEIDPTSTPLENYSFRTETTVGTTEKDATGVEKPVPRSAEYANIAPFHVVHLIAAVPQIIHFCVPLWVLQENKLPQILRNPLLLRSSEMGLQLRVNKAVAQLKNQPGALQLDGGLDPIKEERSVEGLEPKAESSHRRIPGDDESLSSGNDLERSVFTWQHRNDMCRRNSRIHLTNGVMSINGKNYVIKEMPCFICGRATQGEEQMEERR